MYRELAGEFRNLSADVLRRAVPSKDAQILWQSYIDPLVDPFTTDEVERQSTAKVRGLEVRGTLKLPEIGFELIAKADRIDQSSDGAIIYDYKSRKPNGTDIAHFDKQLILEALILEAGGFQDLPSMTVDKVAHIEFANEAKTTPVKQANEALSTERDHLVRLLSAYLIDGQGFASKRISKDAKYAGDYDQLARFGEWDETAVVSLIRVT